MTHIVIIYASMTSRHAHLGHATFRPVPPPNAPIICEDYGLQALNTAEHDRIDRAQAARSSCFAAGRRARALLHCSHPLLQLLGTAQSGRGGQVVVVCV